MPIFSSQLKLETLLLALFFFQNAQANALAQAPSSLSLGDACLAGLTRPFVSLDHLGFILLLGPYALTVSKRCLDPLWFIFLVLVGTALQFFIGAVPWIALGVALSLVVMLLFQWIGARMSHWSSAFILLAGLLHGLALGSAISQESHSPSVYLAYTLSFACIMTVLAYSFGQICRSMQLKAPADYDSLENLISAIISGIALTYLVWAIQ